MPDDPALHSAAHRAQSFHLGEVFRIIGVTLLTGGALGYLIAKYDDETLRILARIVGAVGLTTIVLMIFEARRRNRLDQFEERIDRVDTRLERIERMLSRDAYWRAYSDVMSDLGGINGEDSGDISTNRRER